MSAAPLLAVKNLRLSVKTDEGLARWETEHEQQVQEADAVMAQIGELEPSSPAWLAQVTMLKDTLAQHIAHEENDIWPRIRQAWGQDKLDDAGAKIAAAKAAGKAGATVSEAVGKAMESLKQAVGQR